MDATRHCALSRVCRWSFLLADYFCERLGVNLISGTHLPKNADVKFSTFSDSGSESGDTESLVSQTILLSFFFIANGFFRFLFTISNCSQANQGTISAKTNRYVIVAPVRRVIQHQKMDHNQNSLRTPLDQCLIWTPIRNQFEQLRHLRTVPAVVNTDHLVHRLSLALYHIKQCQAHSMTHKCFYP